MAGISAGGGATKAQAAEAVAVDKVNKLLKSRRRRAMSFLAEVEQGKVIGNSQYHPMLDDISAELGGVGRQGALELVSSVLKIMIKAGIL